MSDISLVVVKPECFFQTEAVGRSLEGRGYSIVSQQRHSFWDIVSRRFYEGFGPGKSTPQQMDRYIALYDERCLGRVFSSFVVEHPEADIIARLDAEKGDIVGYQHERFFRGGVLPLSLRAEFGYGSEHNVVCDGRVLTFNGIHVPSSSVELERNLRVLCIR